MGETYVIPETREFAGLSYAPGRIFDPASYPSGGAGMAAAGARVTATMAGPATATTASWCVGEFSRLTPPSPVTTRKAVVMLFRCFCARTFFDMVLLSLRGV